MTYTYAFPPGFTIDLDVKDEATRRTETVSFGISVHQADLFHRSDDKAIALPIPKDPAVRAFLAKNPDQLRRWRHENIKPLLEDDPATLAWLSGPSTIALRLYTSLYVGDSRRRSDNAPACTHFLEMAHFGFNNPDIPPNYPRDVVAFILQAHDLVEDFGKDFYYVLDPRDPLRKRHVRLPPVTPENIVWAAWKGDPAWGPFIANKIRQYTDDPALKGKKRMDAQVQLANDDPSLILAIGRGGGDKPLTRLHDQKVFIDKVYPLAESYETHLAKFMRKCKMVQELATLPPFYKALMNDIVDETFEIFEDTFFQNPDAKSTPTRPKPPQGGVCDLSRKNRSVTPEPGKTNCIAC